MPAVDPAVEKLNNALAMLRSAFPLTQFKIVGGQITGGGVTVAPGLIAGAPLALVRIVAAQLKAIEEQQAADAKKAADDAARAAQAPQE